ncbi:MAG: ABC transporter ATP-binding protein [Negativicutes bacterium]|nr:ABC transporter ATP-binding protein [Negativicutes bacterium]
MLRLESVNVAYGDIQVLWDLSLAVEAGEIISIVGANGAGKTTTVRTISGLIHPFSGRITFDNQDISRLEPYEILSCGIAHIPEGRQLFSDMTVLENLELGAFSKAAKEKRSVNLAKVFERFPRLEERKKQAAGTLSGGEQQMLAIGRGLMSMPRCVLFDEPSLGLAPNLVENILAIVRQIAAEGIAVILVEQEVRKALKTSHRGYVLENGRIVTSGRSEDLLADPQIKKAYLGL